MVDPVFLGLLFIGLSICVSCVGVTEALKKIASAIKEKSK